MQPTTEILERISKDSLTHKEEVFTRLYRYLLRPDIYYQAYQRLYTNKGASTKGINQDTADGFSEAKIEKIIQSLADETYQPTPVRRTYIAKKSNPKKKRPLGIPTFTDKLVQEALRMILEAIYEPLFLDCSHGFRPKRSCHTALDKLKYQFGGVRWFVEGDIKGCFDNINHDALVGFIGSKVKDARIVKLVYKFLKAGYLEDWVYHKTYSGTPQGGILSPLLANIYLHELDKFVMQLKDEFDTPEKGKITPEYRELHNRIKNLCYHIDRKNGVERESMIAECKTLRKQLLKTPCTAQADKKLKYIRYAHYTSPTVIRAIYDAVEKMGFRSGNILEPSMGVGNFFGMLPDTMQDSRLYGVELDSITGRIAQKLYPEASIKVAGFETTDRRDFYDLAVGNVPFGQCETLTY